jgi:hypothetical protein
MIHDNRYYINLKLGGAWQIRFQNSILPNATTCDKNGKSAALFPFFII